MQVEAWSLSKFIDSTASFSLHAGIIADWAVGACEGLSGLTQPAAARAVLSLALRGQAAVAGAAGARGAGGGGGRREAASTAAAAGSEGVNGDDLDLLKEVAADIKSYYDLGGQGGGAARGASRRHLWGKGAGKGAGNGVRPLRRLSADAACPGLWAWSTALAGPACLGLV